MKHFFSSVFSGFLCGLLVASHAGQAQDSDMSLMGIVQSDANEPLSGAAIMVIHLPSGTRHAAASDGAGRFVVPNLMGGGPYLVRVGEGGYRPQTMENIFLENGKTTNFTVRLSKLGAPAPGKVRSGRTSEPTLALAPESVVGGPILLISSKGQPSAAPAPLTSVHTPAGAASATTPAAPAAAPRPYARNYRYPAHRAAAKDFVVPGHYDAASGNYIYDTGQPTTLKLAGGAVIAGVGVNSTESNLYRFLTDPQKQVDTLDLTTGWYSFDRVFFTPGKATLTAESIHQLRNLAALLRAYPTARVKLGGYTDSTGTYKVNKLLSDARARTAWASLVEMGISPARIDARGYGPRYAIAPNTTEEGRAMNRRLSVKVLQK